MTSQSLISYKQLCPALSASCKIAPHPEHSHLIKLNFELFGPLEEILWPAAQISQPRELWRHSCFEFFEFDGQSEQYDEWNFSKLGEWEHYAFQSYRQPRLSFHGLSEPFISTARESSTHLMLEILVPKVFQTSFFQSALILDLDKRGQDYFALEHPGPQADFHRRLNRHLAVV